MEIGVTGTAVHDVIDTADGVRIEDAGGIHYALAALRALAPPGVRVVPVLPEGTNEVRIVYRPDGSRDETLTRGTGPLGWEDLAPWVGRLDAWLWNFVSGMETDRATFGRVKAAFAGTLHLDVHSLCLEHPHGGPRRFRPPERWEEWVEGATWVQVNEVEAGLLWSGRPEPSEPAAERALAARVAALGAEGLLVSRGPRGATWLPAAGEPLDEPARGADRAVDPTGCGDVLGAAWVALRAGRGLDARAALAGAVLAAGRAAGHRGATGLERVLTPNPIPDPSGGPR